MVWAVENVYMMMNGLNNVHVKGGRRWMVNGYVWNIKSIIWLLSTHNAQNMFASIAKGKRFYCMRVCIHIDTISAQHQHWVLEFFIQKIIGRLMRVKILSYKKKTLCNEYTKFILHTSGTHLVDRVNQTKESFWMIPRTFMHIPLFYHCFCKR